MKKILGIGMVAVLLLVTMIQPVFAGSSGISVSGIVKVQSPDLCSPNLIGVGVGDNILNFGTLIPGSSVSKTLPITITANGYDDCVDVAPTDIPVLLTVSDWQGNIQGNFMDNDITTVVIPEGIIVDENGYSVFPIGVTTTMFTVNIPSGAISDTYTQIISITAIY